MEKSKSASRQALRDYSLIEQALAGSQQAYRILFKRYWRQLFFTVNKIIPDREEAKDVAIESFSKAFGNLHRFRPGYSFSTWLNRVAINHTLDHLRKRRLPTTPLSTFDLEDAFDFFFWSNDKDRQPINPEELVISYFKISV